MDICSRAGSARSTKTAPPTVVHSPLLFFHHLTAPLSPFDLCVSPPPPIAVPHFSLLQNSLSPTTKYTPPRRRRRHRHHRRHHRHHRGSILSPILRTRSRCFGALPSHLRLIVFLREENTKSTRRTRVSGARDLLTPPLFAARATAAPVSTLTPLAPLFFSPFPLKSGMVLHYNIVSALFIILASVCRTIHVFCKESV